VNARIVAFVPDLMDRSKVAAAAVGRVRFADTPSTLVVSAVDADLVVVDLARDGVLDAIPDVAGLGVRVIGFGRHDDRELLDEAHALGCQQVLARSAFFGRIGELLA
jgi:hypothetical protein